MVEALRVDASKKRRSATTTSERLPDLTFPDIEYSKQQVPWDLRRFLYQGSAGTKVRVVYQKIDAGDLGSPMKERVELVIKMHEVLANSFGRGARRSTVSSYIECLKLFFVWADKTDTKLGIDSVESAYLFWTDMLLHRVRVVKDLSESAAYSAGSRVGRVLDRVLGNYSAIIKTTRLRKPKGGLRAVSSKADKQKLEDAFAFGHFLLDIADGLNLEAIWGALPVKIPLRNGLVLDEWSRLKAPSTIKPPNPKYPHHHNYLAKNSAKNRADYEADRTLRTRYPLVNLRIQAEMFMLMSQPAVNLAQVHQLRLDQWKFKPSSYGYELRTYKHRRWGSVIFEIYPEYRKVFERYLEWRKAIFSDDPNGLLFPLIGYGRLEETSPDFGQIRERCKRAGIKFLPPSQLRNIKANWMVRRDNNPERTAEAMQHSVETFHRNYEKPSQQLAMVQAKLYWAKADPAKAAAGPGSCAGKAHEPIPNIPPTATRPDCTTPAGCLFCVHQRDIDSLDHIWSLVSYRLLKSYELATHRKPELRKDQPKHPAELVIDRLTSKLAHFKASSIERETWLHEALLRIEEGRYHPDWAAMIEGGYKERSHEA